MPEPKPHTHSAFTRKREGRRHRWLQVGTARLEADCVIHVIMDTSPIGGFDGYLYCSPIGGEPPDAEPERPGQFSEERND